MPCNGSRSYIKLGAQETPKNYLGNLVFAEPWEILDTQTLDDRGGVFDGFWATSGNRLVLDDKHHGQVNWVKFIHSEHQSCFKLL